MANTLFPLEAFPNTVTQLPTMMSSAEVDLLFSLAKYYYSGEGKIVDAGIFLGASTNAFVQGLRQNVAWETFSPRLVHSYERAVVTQAMLRYPDLPPEGEDYSHILRSKLDPLGDTVSLHLGDILEEGAFEEPIEILFLDILKMPKIFTHCNKIFMPFMIPGRTIVIQQDYYWYLDWWINAYMMLYPDCFKIIEQIGSSCVFLYTAPLPDSAFGNPLSGLGHGHIKKLLLNSRSNALTVYQYLMSELCIVDFCLTRGWLKAAAEDLEAFMTRYSSILENSALNLRSVRLGHQALVNRLRVLEERARQADTSETV